MQDFFKSPGQFIFQPALWLFGLLLILAAFHVCAVWNMLRDTDVLTISILFWATVIYLLWERRASLRLTSTLLATLAGMALLILVALKGTFFYTPFAQITPLISLVALILIASGFGGWRQYPKELTVMAILVSSTLATTLAAPYLDKLALVTAQFGHLVLLYSGFDALRQGTLIRLPTGAIDVYAGCSGFESMMQLLRLALLFLVLFPAQLWQKFLVPLVALSIAFAVNGMRVALMAVLVAGGDLNTFEYWHQGDGSNIFSVVAMLAFGVFCRYGIWREAAESRPL